MEASIVINSWKITENSRNDRSLESLYPYRALCHTVDDSVYGALAVDAEGGEMKQDADISAYVHGEPAAGKFVLKFWAPRAFYLDGATGTAELASTSHSDFVIQTSVDKGETWIDKALLRFGPGEAQADALDGIDIQLNKGDLIGIYCPGDINQPPANIGFTLRASVDDGNL